jgi:6-phosphogluconolactonase
MSPKINIYPTQETLSVAVAGHVALLAARAMAERGRFFIALSGGSVTKIISAKLVAEPIRSDVDWWGWHVFWADERCVPLSSPESNYGVANRLLFRHVDIPHHQIYVLDDTLGAIEAAEAYESILRRVFRPQDSLIPKFDLILLGIGEDGHTASLFPGSPILHETDRWVAPILDAPKPPPERVTLTLPVINNARHVIFVAAGTGKKFILSKVFTPNLHRPRLPAELVGPFDGDLQWFADEAAAGNLRIHEKSEMQSQSRTKL